ncbi:hypothetical protein pf16_66 [Pseudomonas phage pf16]|uniref:Uncharacterized protein n=1 Tax=Pseudomonas phage pf16 TaxID=1815630 RepID=A0A1S5R3L2_9CAUD|nr:hypothetical protein FDG98_gp232 [Pseudomonas phage pf16]AND74989.1 hypothetical protein pf16_66 [Pseudomonas phage pf16]
MQYRVLMEDQVNGKKFNFAVTVDVEAGPTAAHSYTYAALKASAEFPEARVIETRLVEVVDVAA